MKKIISISTKKFPMMEDQLHIIIRSLSEFGSDFVKGKRKKEKEQNKFLVYVFGEKFLDKVFKVAFIKQFTMIDDTHNYLKIVLETNDDGTRREIKIICLLTGHSLNIFDQRVQSYLKWVVKTHNKSVQEKRERTKQEQTLKTSLALVQSGKRANIQ